MARTAPDGDSLKLLHGCNQLELTMFAMLDSIGPQWAAAPDTTSTENFREAAQLLVRRRLVAARDETIVQCSENGQRMRFVLCLTGDWSESYFYSVLEECFPPSWRVDRWNTHRYRSESGRWLEFRLGSKADMFHSVVRRANARDAFDWLYSQPSPAAISVESHEMLAVEGEPAARRLTAAEIVSTLTPPLTENEAAVFAVIHDNGPKSGKEIVNLGLTDQSTLTKTIIPSLKKRELVRNRRGAGYYSLATEQAPQ